MKLKVGQTAPELSLPNQDGKIINLADYKGNYVLLYFYPKDDTPGCRKEACTFSDSIKEFKKVGFIILGVSADSISSHKKFSNKYSLGFDLLSDEKKDIVKAYGVWGKKKFMGREYLGVIRQSFLIDPQGKIAKIYEKVKPLEHAGEVMADRLTFG